MDASEDLQQSLARTRAREQDFIGLDLSAAQDLARELGLQLRVIDADGVAVTADLRPNRMTVDVRSGTVTTAFAG